LGCVQKQRILYLDLADYGRLKWTKFALAYVAFRFLKCPRNIEQIKFLLGHSSIQTTERYLGSEQEIEIAVNDNLGL